MDNWKHRESIHHLLTILNDSNIDKDQIERFQHILIRYQKYVSQLTTELQDTETFVDTIERKLMNVSDIDQKGIIMPLFKKIVESEDEEIDKMLKDMLMIAKLRFVDVEEDKPPQSNIGMTKINRLRNLRNTITGRTP